MVDWSVQKNARYLIAVFIVFLLIPQLVLCTPGLAGEMGGWIDGETQYRAALLYSAVVWLLSPLIGLALTLRRVFKGERFCPLLPAAAEASVLTYLLRVDVGPARGPVLALSLGPLLMLLLECFALLGRYDAHGAAGRKHRLLAGAAENCRFLALLAFVAAGLPAVCGIFSIYINLANMGGIPGAVMSIAGGLFKGLLFALILMLLPVYQALRDERLTAGGAVGVLLLYLPAALVWSMDIYRFYNLMFITIGFALLFLVEGFIALMRRVVDRAGTGRSCPPEDDRA